MRKALLLSAFLIFAEPALAAEPAQCDATAFTLKKPAQTAAKAEKPKPPTAQAAPGKATAKKTTTRLISDCKDEKKKKTR